MIFPSLASRAADALKGFPNSWARQNPRANFVPGNVRTGSACEWSLKHVVALVLVSLSPRSDRHSEPSARIFSESLASRRADMSASCGSPHERWCLFWFWHALR